ncbi:c-type cytochrome biogenesis protein CcsB [Candidatus Sumerlaeota bacterium]|nr:c-type cytochrome biogenesis protein CcsB [Candidatus Sumerlaeota bacterium]
MKLQRHWMTILFLTLAMLAGGALMGLAKTGEFDYAALEGVAVQDFGSVKTLLTYASERAQAITGKAVFEGRHPIETLLEIIAQPEEWRDRRVIRVDHPELVAFFNLTKEKYRRVSVSDLSSRESIQYLWQHSEASGPLGKGVRKLLLSDQAFIHAEEELALIPVKGDGATWFSPLDSEAETVPGGTEIVEAWREVCAAYRDGDAERFNAAAGRLAALNRQGVERAGGDLRGLAADRLYTKMKPLRWSFVLYLFAFLCSLGVLVFRREGMWQAVIGLLSAGLALHLCGMGLRWLIAGRAPLSNLYESFVFAIAGMIFFAIVFDVKTKNRLAGACGALLGFICLVLADKMPVMNSELRPLMPALQSSWLTYHVITIMLSYSAFALSFMVSVLYVICHAFKIERPYLELKRLDFFNYRIIAVGFPLLTIGIITGAVWAATAWGRPWAFDPKETWSAITWVIYGIYLHVRFLPKGRGLWSAILSIIGFAAVLFTYLGVNLLLSGLHSYAA